MNTRHFINLSSGLDWMPEFAGRSDVSFIRVQSTWCEQKRWDDLLRDIDSNLLMHLALGYECIIYDASAKRDMSRALWQGIEMLRYCLSAAWGLPYDPPSNMRGIEHAASYFHDVWSSLDTHTKRKLRYFSKFLHTDELKLRQVCRRTNLDGRYDELAMLAHLHAEPSPALA